MVKDRIEDKERTMVQDGSSQESVTTVTLLDIGNRIVSSGRGIKDRMSNQARVIIKR